MAHLSPTVFNAQRKQLLGKMLLDYEKDKQARLKKRDEETSVTCWSERKAKNPILNGMDSMALGMLSLHWHH